MDLPITREIHCWLRRIRRRLVRLGLNREVALAAHSAVDALQATAVQFQAQLAAEIVPLRNQLARLDAGRGGTHRLGIFEEADARGRFADFQPKRNQLTAGEYGGVPGSIETSPGEAGCQGRAGHGEESEEGSHS